MWEQVRISAFLAQSAFGCCLRASSAADELIGQPCKASASVGMLR
jgi:hypothetical protein